MAFLLVTVESIPSASEVDSLGPSIKLWMAVFQTLCRCEHVAALDLDGADELGFGANANARQILVHANVSRASK